MAYSVFNNNDVNGAPMDETAERHHHHAELHCPVCYRQQQLMVEQIAEIHAFIKGVGEALNNPMIKSMLPPNMRGSLGG